MKVQLGAPRWSCVCYSSASALAHKPGLPQQARRARIVKSFRIMNFKDAPTENKPAEQRKVVKTLEGAQPQITRHPVRTIIEPFRVKVRT